MKLLYVSCHSILEYDELKLFHEMGIDVFSHGGYCNPTDPSMDPKRPMLNIPYYPELCLLAKGSSKEAIAPELFEWADIIMYMGMSHWVRANWNAMQGKRVIWRSIGQSAPAIEQELAELQSMGMEIVRYSPAEREIPGYAGDGVTTIRFYKDPEEFGGWHGTMPQIISVGQMVKHRDHYCGLTWYERATEGLCRALYGPHNSDIDTMPTALLSYGALKDVLRKNRAFFYTGTFPAPYTLGFVEAWVMGIPVVAIGPGLRNHHFSHHQSYEIPDLIEDGVTGYWSDDIDKLHSVISGLLNNHALAQQIGAAGRAVAIPLFGKETVMAQWKRIL
uniref:Putative glycosyltransferase n=1 Tax=viral metagenome TaxID=1070528 RepID=A0A6H1ZD44_9ZZZZ